MGLGTLANCRCRAEKKMADIPPFKWNLYHPPKRAPGLAALDDDTVDWLKKSTLSI